MDISIIIINYNTLDLVLDCIKSIKDNTKGVIFEIILVDNNSSDFDEDKLRVLYPEVKIVKNSSNLGFGRANNVGVAAAKGKYVFLLNSDTLLIDNALKQFYDFFECDKENKIGISGGNLIGKDGSPMHSCRKTYKIIGNEFKRLNDKIYFLLFKKRRDYNYAIEPVCVDFISGANMFMRKIYFDELNGFDPSFFMYYEDFDLCIRMRKLGKKLYSIPYIKIMHLEGASTNNNLVKYEMIMKSKYHLYFKYNKKVGIFLHIISQIKYSLLFLFGQKEAKEKIKINKSFFKMEFMNKK